MKNIILILCLITLKTLLQADWDKLKKFIKLRNLNPNNLVLDAFQSHEMDMQLPTLLYYSNLNSLLEERKYLQSYKNWLLDILAPSLDLKNIEYISRLLLILPYDYHIFVHEKIIFALTYVISPTDLQTFKDNWYNYKKALADIKYLSHQKDITVLQITFQILYNSAVVIAQNCISPAYQVSDSEIQNFVLSAFTILSRITNIFVNAYTSPTYSDYNTKIMQKSFTNITLSSNSLIFVIYQSLFVLELRAFIKAAVYQWHLETNNQQQDKALLINNYTEIKDLYYLVKLYNSPQLKAIFQVISNKNKEGKFNFFNFNLVYDQMNHFYKKQPPVRLALSYHNEYITYKQNNKSVITKKKEKESPNITIYYYNFVHEYKLLKYDSFKTYLYNQKDFVLCYEETYNIQNGFTMVLESPAQLSDDSSKLLHSKYWNYARDGYFKLKDVAVPTFNFLSSTTGYFTNNIKEDKNQCPQLETADNLDNKDLVIIDDDFLLVKT